MSQDQKLRKIHHGLVILYVITIIFALLNNSKSSDANTFFMITVACITPLMIPLLFKIMHWQPVYEIYISSTLFTYFASLLGSGLHFYQFPYFDKVLHFSSGIFGGLAGILLFMILKKKDHFEDPSDINVLLVFTNTVNISIAACWEFFEYAMLVFFNNDGINHYTTGVHDSMTDMICALIAGGLFTFSIHAHYVKGKENLFSNLCSKFYSRNIEGQSKSKC